MTAELIIATVGGPDQSSHTISPQTPATIGRGTGCLIEIDDRHISKKHAQLSYIDGAWHVTDLDSHNGTWVNDWKVPPSDPMLLRNGDELKVGPHRFRVTLAGQSDPEPVPSGGGGGTYATRASIFLRLKDDRASVQEVGWQEFRQRYAPVIIGYCRQNGLRGPDAEDILQEVMMGFFRRVPDFEYDPSKGHFRGYLKRATLNAVRKRARKRSGEAVVSDDWLEGQVESEKTQWETQWADQLFERALEEARGRFDAKTMEAFELYCRRNVPAEQVAEQLGVGVNSVHQAKSRVLGAIRSIVTRLEAEEG